MHNQKQQLSVSKPRTTQWRKSILSLGIAMVFLVGLGNFSCTQSNTPTQEKVAATATNRVFGRAMDIYTEAWLSDVKVSIDNVSTMTDAEGNFVLNVPDDPKKQYYRINYYKKTYMKDYLDSIPAKSEEEIMIRLMKEPRK